MIDYVNNNYKENYTIVYKRNGDRDEVVKVEKPAITPVEVNREAQSPFLTNLIETESPKMQPRFIDYEKDIKFLKTASGVDVHYLKNDENKLFSMYYLLEMGSRHDKKMDFAIEYLKYLGTDKYTPEEIKKKFYQIGCEFNVFTSSDQIYVYLNGLDKNFDAGVQLFEELLANAKADTEALKNLVEGEKKSRADAKLSKRAVRRALQNYGSYGARNPYNDVLSQEELESLSPEELVEKINVLTSFEHRVLYYGPDSDAKVTEVLNKYHKVPAELTPIPAADKYTYLRPSETKVLFAEFDMVQAEVLWITASKPFDNSMSPIVRLYNEYYGGNMSSIIFQTIRESKALAYSTYSKYDSPRYKEDPFSLVAYVGTQADKIHEAIAGMNELLNEMPEAENLLAASKASIKNKIETERIIRTSILFNLESARRLGRTEDARKDQYESIPNLGFEDLKAFHGENIAGQNFNMCITGSKDRINLDELKRYGPVEELTLEQIFGD